MADVFVGGFIAVLPLPLLAVLFARARSLRRRALAPWYAQWFAFTLLIAATIAMAVGAISACFVARYDDDGAAVEAPQNARALAESISEGLHVGLWAALLAAAAALALHFTARKWPKP